jgi:hypothetical protein
VQLTIDGLSLFTFSELRHAEGPRKGRPLYSRVICPRGSCVIRGWHITNEKSDAFLVTRYAQSAAAELKNAGSVGTITATFAAAWPKGKRPADEVLDRSPDLATGRGAKVDQTYEPVELEWGLDRAAVSIRYVK